MAPYMKEGCQEIIWKTREENLTEVGMLAHVYYMRPEHTPTKHVPWDGSEDSLFCSERATSSEKLKSDFPL